MWSLVSHRSLYCRRHSERRGAVGRHPSVGKTILTLPAMSSRWRVQVLRPTTEAEHRHPSPAEDRNAIRCPRATLGVVQRLGTRCSGRQPAPPLVRSQSAGDQGRMPGHIAPQARTMSLIPDLSRRRHWRFLRRLRSGSRFRRPEFGRSLFDQDNFVPASESNPGRKRPLGPSPRHQASSQRPKPPGSVNSVQSEGTLHALSRRNTKNGDMIHWASKRTAKAVGCQIERGEAVFDRAAGRGVDA